jgi:hypothetical protein
MNESGLQFRQATGGGRGSTRLNSPYSLRTLDTRKAKLDDTPGTLLNIKPDRIPDSPENGPGDLHQLLSYLCRYSYNSPVLDVMTERHILLAMDAVEAAWRSTRKTK